MISNHKRALYSTASQPHFPHQLIFPLTDDHSIWTTCTTSLAAGLTSCSSQKRTSAAHHCPLNIFKGAKTLSSKHSEIIKFSQRKLLHPYLMFSKFRSDICLIIPWNWVPGTFLSLAMKVLCPKKPLSLRKTEDSLSPYQEKTHNIGKFSIKKN